MLRWTLRAVGFVLTIVGLVSLPADLRSWGTVFASLSSNTGRWLLCGLGVTLIVLVQIWPHILPLSAVGQRPSDEAQSAGAHDVAERRRLLRSGEAMPRDADELAHAWQGWCDEATALLRRNGFMRDGEPAAAIPPNEAAVQEMYWNGLRNRGVDLAEYAIAQGLMPERARFSFQGSIAAARLYELVDWLYTGFIEPVRDGQEPVSGPPESDTEVGSGGG